MPPEACDSPASGDHRGRAEPQLEGLLRWWPLFGLALVATTWPLWTGRHDLPQIPVSRWLIDAPSFVDRTLLTVLLAGWTLLLWARLSQFRSSFRRDEADKSRDAEPTEALSRYDRVCCGAIAGGMCGLMLLNQQRLQPWAWQFFWIALWLAVGSKRATLAAWRWQVIGIYGWSAWSKVDATFLHDLGPWMLFGLARSMGVETWFASLGPNKTWLLACTLPYAEGLAALLLSFGATRTVGLLLSIAMHLALLAALGPLGHDQGGSVLAWNLFFIGQNVLLFARPIPQRPSARPHRVVLASAMLLNLWPGLADFGGCDAWQAWAVYSHRTARVRFALNPEAVASLPQRASLGIDAKVDEQFLVTWRIDRWALNATRAPILPQDRFQLAMIAELARRHPPESFEVRWSNFPNRRTGDRTTRVLRSQDELQFVLDQFWLNTIPRRTR